MPEKHDNVDSETRHFIEAINSTFDILGVQSKEALLYHLENSYGIDINRSVPSDLENMTWAIKQLLGEFGAELIHFFVKSNCWMTLSRCKRDFIY